LLVGFLLTLMLTSFPTGEGQASEAIENIDYEEIQQVIDDIMADENPMDFGAYVERLMSGEETFSITGIGNQLLQSVKGEVKANIGTFARLISIALVAAIFTNLSMAFKNSQVSETGYYVTYLLMFSLLISSFITASMIASSAIEKILDFMKALVPAYFMSVGFCTGSATSLVFYQAALVIISIVDLILLKIVIPLINIYLVIVLANNLSKEDMLSRLGGLFETIIKWMLKSLLAAVLGFQAIQGMIVPIADQVKRSALLKGASAIPGIGNTIGGVTETILGAGVLLKNAIGVAGLIVILVICAVPILKLAILTLIFKCGSAALQPISDKRIIECISASARSAELLLHSVFVGGVLFLLSITIVAVSTGGVR
jgi:stage III sporulation protein AE